MPKRGNPEIAARLVFARKKAGLSQEALAERMGVNRKTIGHWETSARAIDLQDAESFGRHTGVDALWLLRGDAAYPESDPTIAPLVKRVRELPLEEREAIVQSAIDFIEYRLSRRGGDG